MRAKNQKRLTRQTFKKHTKLNNDDFLAAQLFVTKHSLHIRSLSFIVNSPGLKLVKATEGDKGVDIISQEFLEVRGILRADYALVEMDAVLCLEVTCIYGIVGLSLELELAYPLLTGSIDLI